MHRGQARGRRSGGTPRWPVLLIVSGLLGLAITAVLAAHSIAAAPPSPLQPHMPAPESTATAGPDRAVSPAQPSPASPPPSPAPPVPASAPVMPPSIAASPAPPPPAPAGLSELAATLEEYLAGQEGTYGISLIDLNSGESAGVNDQELFPTASTFKLPMAMYILNQVASGKAALTDPIAYTADDYEDGTGVLQESVEVGDSYPVGQLIDLAITQSDNIATNMLLRHFGRDNVIAYTRTIGATQTGVDEGTVVSTPRDMARFMQLAHSGKGIANKSLRTFLDDLLSKTAFHDRVAAGVPAGVRVDHKIGTLPNVVNDVAMVYAPGRTFVVAIFSRDVSEEVAPDVITEATRQIYDFEVTRGRKPSAPAHSG